MGAPIRLPHPELVDTAARLGNRIPARRGKAVAGTYVTYFLYDPDSELSGMDACYDESGRILVSHDLFALDPRVADLVAFHEHVEIEAKRHGQPHHRAHRRAFVDEIIAAKELFNDPPGLQSYSGVADWRVSKEQGTGPFGSRRDADG